MRVVARQIAAAFLILFVMCVAGCGGESATSSKQVAFERVRTISIQETDSLYLGNFLALTVTSDPLRIYVPDLKLHRIAVLDSTGRILDVFGRRGRGPGELVQPTHVAAAGKRLYVAESNRFSVFDTTGTFVETLRLPEGFSRQGRHAMLKHGDYLYAATANMKFRDDMRVTEGARPVSILTDSLDLVDTLGVYPDIYREMEITGKWRDLAVTGDDRLAVVYDELPIVDVYDVRRPRGSNPHLQRLDLASDSYQKTDSPLPPEMPLKEKKEVWLKTSSTSSVWTVADSLVVMTYQNKKRGYFDNRGDDDFSTYYAAVAGLEGTRYGTVELPGPMMGQDASDRLYVRTSNVPDERTLGVFRLRLK
jgi:hypothetical protein